MNSSPHKYSTYRFCTAWSHFITRTRVAQAQGLHIFLSLKQFAIQVSCLTSTSSLSPFSSTSPTFPTVSTLHTGPMILDPYIPCDVPTAEWRICTMPISFICWILLGVVGFEKRTLVLSKVWHCFWSRIKAFGMCMQCISVQDDQPTQRLLLEANSCNVHCATCWWLKTGQRTWTTNWSQHCPKKSRRLRNYTSSRVSKKNQQRTGHVSRRNVT